MKQTMKRFSLCLVLLLTFTIPKSFASGQISYNVGTQNYTRRASTTDSNLVENSSGYLRIEYISGNTITLEQYDKNFSFLTSSSVPLELEQFVDFYEGVTHYYILFSASNPAENNYVEVARVVKYDKNWNRLGSTSLTDIGTIGDIVTADMVEYNNMLHVHTCRQKYKGDDGLNHQTNLRFTINSSSMSLVNVSTESAYLVNGYSSHSFNQLIDVSTDGYLVTADHGDAYPRNIVAFSWSGNNIVNNRPLSANVFSIYGDYSQYGNTTGVRIGGLEVGTSAVLLAGSSVTQNSGIGTNSDYNVFVTATPRDNFADGTTNTTWLTSYTGNTYASNPYLVELSEDHFVVLWNELPAVGTATLCWASFDGSGTQISEVEKSYALLSEVQPIFTSSGEIVWYSTSNSQPLFCALDLTNGTVRNSGQVKVSDISFNILGLSMEVGERQTVKATVSPSNAPTQIVTWSTSNPAVATVDSSGSVTAVGGGGCEIIATADDISRSIQVFVTGFSSTIPVEKISISQVTMTLMEGKTETLQIIVSPSDATEYALIWSSSDESVATVSTNGLVTAVSRGSTYIKVSCGDVSAMCLVTVKNESDFASTDISLNYSEIFLNLGTSQTLVATVVSSEVLNESIVWTSSDSNVASINSAGLLISKSTGSTTITASIAGKSASCTVTVTSSIIPLESVNLSSQAVSLGIGGTQSLSASPIPTNSTEQTVSWLSNNEEIATISKTGLVTGVSAGTAIITAQIGGKTATCIVTVTNIQIHVESITISTQNLSLEVGSSSSVSVVLYPIHATDSSINWESNNTGVATVTNSGIITGQSAGTALITASSHNGISVSCIVTITAKPYDPTQPYYAFPDVPTTAWYYSNVISVVEQGLMYGGGNGLFQPFTTATRGMLVTILHTLDGNPEVYTENEFIDVQRTDYFADASNWAKSNQIVSGVTETLFAPNRAITREQLATIVYNYVSYRYNISYSGYDAYKFNDSSEISDYAFEAISWVSNMGIMDGRDDGTFDPQNTANRAELATVLVRLTEVMK